MNLSNVLRAYPNGLPAQDGKRAFGKDITNVVRGGFADDPLKKITSKHLPQVGNEKLLKQDHKDAIHEYYE
jgi:hypothetical protein